MALLEVNNLGKHYNGETKVLKNVNFEVGSGEFVSIIGPSGAGKSTLLRCINRMVEISEGSVFIDGQSVGGMKKKSLRSLRTNIGMIFQHYNLVPRLTVIENVLHGRFGYKTNLQGIFGRFTEKEKEKAFELLDKLGIADHAYKRCDQLSGGQQQRVGICRALIQDPKIILCDEPIASLDPNSSKIIMDYLKKITNELGITCLVNLHQVEVAKAYADRIIGLKSGEIVFDGPSKLLYQEKIESIYGFQQRELITV
ncbi:MULTISPECIES: phosphonate ABC transporter ATP-binding protein [Oceanobacillus]|uniref:Phosphonates import ATP-binding protein PhnC n=1 Tax=Oceanobacillus kimchii TaxID=746691 RepID=A0ABQ5TIL3_9BACI|nr:MULTISPECIES: phosphonate ABC transporter ATP-binding protein [Oceanobacillus]MBT2599319.1 phosphonate ABC transporter ATP-binding protein [Oceanobacillus sp. ISL-74]MBT2652237.1 phosphonate ABC transporter ATP-binding protein [Oceanobacillus sp. ISL-73]MCT1578484.1 phosphonate ABC transporter ATP-binding protein [Oceanobacillus kimchii]MCT2136467.1 phosphonate ABC transporter ATP-binding protein [Oceanobacillus kimchii]OEH54124.1 phosphonate ABC transporter ATP-binding protein [Oceanobacil